ncbi:unnamed protein product [Withania somnifera]
MGPERSKALHNFSLPCELKWGSQKYLRCVKVDEEMSELIGRRRRTDAVERQRRKFRSVNGDGIKAVREKLMFDLQIESDKMKESIFRERLQSQSPATERVAVSAAWNLRTRRAACNEHNGFETNGLPPLRTENSKALRVQSDFSSGAAFGGSCVGEKRQRVKYSVSLSRREIEEDFMAMAGHRPPRRPKKRARLVQKNLDTLFPGLWLTEITADLYKVPEDQ